MTKILCLDVTKPVTQTVENYGLEKLGGNLIMREGEKKILCWPMEWFGNDSKIAKKLALALKSFLPPGSTALKARKMRAWLSESDLGIFCPAKPPVNMVDLINYFRKQ